MGWDCDSCSETERKKQRERKSEVWYKGTGRAFQRTVILIPTPTLVHPASIPIENHSIVSVLFALQSDYISHLPKTATLSAWHPNFT